MRFAAITIALMSFVLMQAHSIGYWVSMTDEVRGISFSVALEAAALWLWYLSGITARTFSVIASALVISSALFEVSEPLFSKIHTSTAGSQLIVTLKEEIADHQATLRQYEANSGARSGWARQIGLVRSDLAAARVTLREEMAKTAEIELDFRVYVELLVQALALLVVMVAQILAVLSLRGPSIKLQPIAVEAAPNSEVSGSPVTDLWINTRKGLDPVENTREVASEVAERMKKALTEVNTSLAPEKEVKSASSLEVAELTTMAEEVEAALKRPATVSSPPSLKITDYDLRVKKVADEIRSRLPLFENKQTLMASKLKLDQTSISKILNHLTLKKAGKEQIEVPELKKVEAEFFGETS